MLYIDKTEYIYRMTHVSGRYVFLSRLEKAREIDPFGYAGLTPSGKIRLTLSGKIKITPVEVRQGIFFCSFETPCPGTAGINPKHYII